MQKKANTAEPEGWVVLHLKVTSPPTIHLHFSGLACFRAFHRVGWSPEKSLKTHLDKLLKDYGVWILLRVHIAEAFFKPSNEFLLQLLLWKILFFSKTLVVPVSPASWSTLKYIILTDGNVSFLLALVIPWPFLWFHHEVDICGFVWIGSNTVQSIVLTFDSHIWSTHKMNCNNLGYFLISFCEIIRSKVSFVLYFTKVLALP